MDELEFDEIYREREIRALQIFRDLDFYKVTENFFKSVHKKADLTSAIGFLGETLRETPACRTFGELKDRDIKKYDSARAEILDCRNRLKYSPRS